MTTSNRILNYLANNPGGLTVKECIDILHTTELRKCVSDLRRKGFDISSIYEYGLNSYGDRIRYKRYFLNN